MKAILLAWPSRIRESYWFVPSLMAIGALVLSFVTTALDKHFGAQWIEEIGWLYINKPAGARAVLSTVAGSMITVAGVTFSMTILSISYTTSQVGPRLLNNFMRDTGNQVTLGVFISTFLYCLLVLRTVRNAETAPAGSTGNEDLFSAFVPHIAIIVGILMAIASVGVLIYFIHHIPESIHVSNIVADIGRDLNERIDKEFPTRIGQPHPQKSEQQAKSRLPDSFYEAAQAIHAETTGYVEFIDSNGLMAIARKHDLQIRSRVRPGDFVTPGFVFMLASPQSRLNDQLAEELNSVVVCGSHRTSKQNLRFVFNQLIEIAMRALSPGVNDPFTAMNCLDWLQSALENLSEREPLDAYRFDDDENLRIVVEPEQFDDYASLVFDQLRPYFAADRNAAIHMMEVLAKVALTAPRDEDRNVLLRHAGALRRQCKRSLSDIRGLQCLTERNRTMIRLLRDPEFRQQFLNTGNWLGGRG